MSLLTRTLSFVVIFLSASDGLDSSQVSPGKLSFAPEFGSNLINPVPLWGNSLSNSPFSGPDQLSPAQRLLASQRQIINEVIAPSITSESAAAAVGPSYQQAPIIISPSPNLPTVAETPCNTVSPVVSQPEIIQVDPIPITAQYACPPAYSPQLGYSEEIKQNFVPLGPVPIESIPEGLVHYPDYSQYYRQPITVQIPSMPVIAPFISLAAPAPGMLSQNFPTSNWVPEYNQNVNEQIVEAASIVDTTPVVISPTIGSGLVETMPSYNPQSPFSFQINMPSQVPSEQPIILISPGNPAPIPQDYSTMPSFPPMMPPPPVIVTGRSRSSWRNWLPILLIAMFDGGCGNGDNGGGCCGGSNIPIPYPIPIPTNNPIILGRGRAKGNTTTTATPTNSTSTTGSA